MNEKKEEKINNVTFELAGEPVRRIPKYSNNVGAQTLPNGDIVITFMVLDNPLNQGANQGTLIERIIVDKQHAKKIAEVLLKHANQ